MSADKYPSIFSHQMEAIVYNFIMWQGLEVNKFCLVLSWSGFCHTDHSYRNDHIFGFKKSVHLSPSAI